ncbi:putative glutathione S-transferase [Mycena metata]|uniref:Glutathione S-transferase n=1 Tax=Mycena metata TaxID=1033252 RepID=A0AAD7I7P2_9AGAR|nr:putative glutathione S-transferase [Mycena metata]
MRYRHFMHYCEGSLMPLRLLKVRSPNDNKDYLDDCFATHFAFLEEQLSSAPDGGPYLCGATLSGADFVMSYPVLLVTGGWGNLDVDKARFPKLFGYAEALRNIESYRKAEEKIVDLEKEFAA